MLKEWPLVAFTIAGQMAVGVFLLAGLPLFFSAVPANDAAARGPRLVVLSLVFTLLAAAALVSFFHLHHPLRARYVLSNLRTSWLSREIFFELGFMALVALGALLAWRRPAEGGLLTAVLIVAGLAGILFLVSMSKLYMLRTVPPWNSAFTPLSFFLTSLALGALAAALVWGGAFVFLLAVIFVAVELAVSIFLAPGDGLFGHRPGPSLRPPVKLPRVLHLIRLGSLSAGLIVLGAALFPDLSELVGWEALRVAAFALVLAGQVIGRFLFYGLLARPGR